jgi:type IV secretion system protein VirB5
MFTPATRVRLSILLSLLAVSPVHAQWAVVDVGAIAQLIQQVRTLEAQLSTAQDHLAQARAEFDSMTGGRGMERLLTGVQRNYLPTDWPDLQSALQGGSGGYVGLSTGVLNSIGANAVLSSEQLAELPDDIRHRIDTARHIAALSQNVSRQALAATSTRFASLQQLIDALPRATDQKAVLDLQARIGAENAMLQNEQTKLQNLYAVIDAEERSYRQQLREQALAGHGVFARRFQPVP